MSAKTKNDPINPAHYQGDYVMRVIEDFRLDFIRGTVVKYLLRAGNKPGDSNLQDLMKAKWYLERAIRNAAKVATAILVLAVAAHAELMPITSIYDRTPPGFPFYTDIDSHGDRCGGYRTDLRCFQWVPLPYVGDNIVPSCNAVYGPPCVTPPVEPPWVPPVTPDPIATPEPAMALPLLAALGVLGWRKRCQS